jgi:RND family efflux transporter MFP subunit
VNTIVMKLCRVHPWAMRVPVIRGTWLIPFCMVLSGCQPPAVKDPLPIAVQVQAIREESFSTETRYSATVKELQKADLSFKVAGTIQEFYQVPDPNSSQPRDVQVGDAVPPDVVLAQLDDADYRRKWNSAREQLAKAESQRVAAEADAELAAKDLKRAEALTEKGAGTKENLDAAERRQITANAALVSAERDVDAARIAEQQAEDDLNNCALKVPTMALAYVAEKYVERSERVAAAKPAFLLIDVSKVRVAFGVPDNRVTELQLGQNLPVTAEALGEQAFQGRISKISPSADLRTRTFLIEVTIDEPGKLKPGMIVTTSIGENRSGLLVPMTAIQRGVKKDEFIVYRIVPENGQSVAQACRVQLDGVFDNRIHVPAGPGTDLAVDDQVVVVGAWRLHEGQPVRVVPQEVRP